MLKFDYDISSWSFEWFEALWGHAVFWLWIVGKSAHQIFFTFVKTSDWLTTNLIHLQFKSDNVSLKKCYFWVIIFSSFQRFVTTLTATRPTIVCRKFLGFDHQTSTSFVIFNVNKDAECKLFQQAVSHTVSIIA